MCLRAFATKSIDCCDNIGVMLRTGDRAIIVGAVAICVYERKVRDDADLISSRVEAYKQRRPLLTSAVVLITAGHLLGYITPELDPYHRAVVWFRRNVSPEE